MPKWCLAAVFMVTLYLVSGLYAEFVEAPFARGHGCHGAATDEQGLCWREHSVVHSAQGDLGRRARQELLLFLLETDDNKGSASIVFWFVLGLLTPLLGGFTFGLILAAVGWGLSTGGIKKFVEKTESTKQFAEYVTTLNDFGTKGGEYGLKAYNFVAKKSKELTA
eukprot:g7572.t1